MRLDQGRSGVKDRTTECGDTPPPPQSHRYHDQEIGEERRFGDQVLSIPSLRNKLLKMTEVLGAFRTRMLDATTLPHGKTPVQHGHVMDWQGM
jgi:hypothetical protein